MPHTWGPAPGSTEDPDYGPGNPDWHRSRWLFTVHDLASGDIGAGSAIPSAWAPQILDQLDDEGNFSLNIQADDPGHAWARKGRLLTAWIDGDSVTGDPNPIWTGLIRRRKVRPIGQGARRFTTVTGPGSVKVMARNKVYPEAGLGQYPFADDRTFDWTAPGFDDSAWDPVVVTPNSSYGYPEGFPDGTAEWIWDEDSTAPPVPASTKELRGHGTVATTRVHEAWGASDDTHETWLNGVPLLQSASTAYVGRSEAVELLVSAGDVTVAARVTNLNNLKAGYIFSLLVPLDDTVSPAFHSDDTWLFRPTGAPLGMNAGEILVMLFAEAAARGEIVPALTFDAALDSNGDAWTIFEQLTVRIGDSYWDVLRQMVDLQMCEFRMTPGAYELNLYNADGAGGASGVTIEEGVNLPAGSLDIVDDDIEATKLLVRHERGFREVVDAGLVAAHGERGGFLALGAVRSTPAVDSQAAAVLARLGSNLTQVKVGYDAATRAEEPYQVDGFEPGDTATAPDLASASEQRVMEVRTTRDQAGRPRFELTIDSVIAQRAKRTQVTLQRLANGTMGGRSGTATIPYQPRPIRPRPADPIVFNPVEDAVALSVSKPYTFTRAQRIREVEAVLETASSSGSVVVEFKKNGTTFATVTLAAGVPSDSVPLTTDVVFIQRVDVLTVEVTSAGTGAEKLTAKVIAA